MLVVYTIPLSLAAGNIYRTVKRPGDIDVMSMTTGVLLCSALLLIPVVAFDTKQRSALVPMGPLISIVLLQSLVTALGYLVFFRLQKAGGPFYLSQSGYVITAFGLMYSLVFFC